MHRTQTGCACLLGALMLVAASLPARADITQLSSYPADLMEPAAETES